MKIQLLGLVPLLAVSLALAQGAQESGNEATMAKHSATSDSTFMKKLAAGDLAEVDAGRLASEKASNPDVKEFGQEMVKDHSENSRKLDTLAKSHGVEVPTTIDKEHTAAKEKLEAASGSKFDSEYIKAQVQAHEKTVQLLQHEIQHGQNPAVRDFAEKTLPVVEHHLSMAKDLQSKLPHEVAERSSQ